MGQLTVLDWMPEACPIDKIDETPQKKKRKSVKKEKDVFEDYFVEGQLGVKDWMPDACPEEVK